MKRSVVLCLLFVLATLMTAAAQQAPAPRVVEAEKIKDNLYVMRGGGGNSAVFITSRGVVVVDSKNPGWGKPLLDKIREITDKPVVALINSHTHGDHVSGNPEFPPGIDIIAHENAKTRMEKMLPNSANQNQAVPAQTIFQQNGGRGMPTRTFKDKLTLFSGADQVEVYFFGIGNTDGDAWVYFPAHRTAVAADVFGAKTIPLLDSNNGGSAITMVDTIQKAYDQFRNAEIIISGHGPQFTAADLRDFVELNREFLADMRTAKAAGKTIDEVAATWKIPAKYAGWGAADPNRLRNNIRLAYAEMDRTR
jgi:glyoxylase-like metal-dependent hydrolase (beta-lactamase superfamily II)